MLDKIDAILTGVCRLDKRKSVLAGVSGGPDSLCLLSSLHEGGWHVIAAHFNHGLRPEAGDEAEALKAAAHMMGVPFVSGTGNVREHAEEHRLSIETAGRELRYRFLFEQARRTEAQAVAVGHTADDQVETVLMHFVRGAGLNGLKGMAYRSVLREYDVDIPLVRPLLDAWRADTVAWCDVHGLKPHYDSSNESQDFARNRVRHELIPMLESYNPRFREAAWRAGKTLAADHELILQALEPLWETCVLQQTEQYVSLDLRVLSEQPKAAQMHVLRRAAAQLRPEHDTGYEDLRRAVGFVSDQAQEQADFAGGVTLWREGNVLYAATDEAGLPTDQWPQMPAGKDSLRVQIPGEQQLAAGWRCTAGMLDAATTATGASWQTTDPYEAYLDVEGLPAQFELRVRRPGDRFEPLGMDGRSQKLSDFFVNEKLPRRARDRWPLVCAGDEIIWVPGYRPAHRRGVREETNAVLRLSMMRKR